MSAKNYGMCCCFCSLVQTLLCLVFLPISLDLFCRGSWKENLLFMGEYHHLLTRNLVKLMRTKKKLRSKLNLLLVNFMFFFKSSAVLHSMKHKGQIALGVCGIHTLLVIKGNAREYYLAPSSDLHAFTGHPSSVIVSCAYTWCFTRTWELSSLSLKGLIEINLRLLYLWLLVEF